MHDCCCVLQLNSHCSHLPRTASLYTASYAVGHGHMAAAQHAWHIPQPPKCANRWRLQHSFRLTMHPHVALFTPPPVPVAQHFTPTSQQRLTPILAVAPATSAVPQSTSHARVAGATAAAAAVKEALRHADLYSTGDACEELSAAVAGLVANNPSPQPGPDSLTQGQGTWEVRCCRNYTVCRWYCRWAVAAIPGR